MHIHIYALTHVRARAHTHTHTHTLGLLYTGHKGRALCDCLFSPRCPLQDLVEKVMILQKAVELRDGQTQQVSSDILAQKLSSYAGLLAGQGNLNIALMYLSNSTEVRTG